MREITAAPAPSPKSTAVGAVLPVGDPAELLRADHDRVPAVPGFKHRRSYVKRVEEARAASHHVEGCAAEGSEFLLDDAGSGGKAKVIGCGGRHDDKVEVMGGDLRFGQSGTGGVGGHVAGEHALVGDVPWIRCPCGIGSTHRSCRPWRRALGCRRGSEEYRMRLNVILRTSVVLPVYDKKCKNVTHRDLTMNVSIMSI